MSGPSALFDTVHPFLLSILPFIKNYNKFVINHVNSVFRNYFYATKAGKCRFHSKDKYKKSVDAAVGQSNFNWSLWLLKINEKSLEKAGKAALKLVIVLESCKNNIL